MSEKTHEATWGQLVDFVDGEGKALYSVMLGKSGCLSVAAKDSDNSANSTALAVLPGNSSSVGIFRTKDLLK